ncbi:MAG: enoyl-CoA hydratase/isomerase family protein [Acidimicrobiales bacterium]
MTTVGYETIVVERSGGVVSVTLNRPERKNAANALMWQELLATFRQVARDSADRVMVVTGAGGAFCSGADITDPSGVGGEPDDPHLVRMRLLAEVMLALHQIAKPTIAKVRGVAAGAGLSIALGCDLIVASDSARMSEIFARRGLSLDGGASWMLPRMVGLHRAKELAFFAEMISAEEAAAYGLVNRVVPDAELDAFVDDWARRLAAGPPIALSMTKTLLDNSLSTSMAQALEDEARCQAVNLNTEDTAEAMIAFASKREPRFQGR